MPVEIDLGRHRSAGSLILHVQSNRRAFAWRKGHVADRGGGRRQQIRRIPGDDYQVVTQHVVVFVILRHRKRRVDPVINEVSPRRFVNRHRIGQAQAGGCSAGGNRRHRDVPYLAGRTVTVSRIQINVDLGRHGSGVPDVIDGHGQREALAGCDRGFVERGAGRRGQVRPRQGRTA